MHGGMNPYHGSPAAARHYVEADRGRADDYYLAEGTGIAERYVASPGGGVHRLEPLTGHGYEAWVAGVDPDTGVAKGRLRNDDQAVRFVEVIVNGPKSWSLAAELHPDISRAYDAAQDRAAAQIIGWLAQHATTRVGPRGAQLQVPVAEIEAVTVRHHTSRAGDPHRHLHLQINARVFAEGQWRGLHTVGVRDCLDAINGIGHAAVMCDPVFRDALATRGFTLDPESGEVTELAAFVGPFSARAAQIGRNIACYEADWRTANPGREPDPRLRRVWDARAWADARPDKVVPRDGAELTQRWIHELHALGYRERLTRAPIGTLPVGALDRDRAGSEVLSRLAARRSGWNGADIRGEVEQLLARQGVVVEAAVRGELAEDLTARALDRCVPLLSRDGVPEHIRVLTSQPVLDVEGDLVGRLAVRGAQPSAEAGHDVDAAARTRAADSSGRWLDAGQAGAVAALAGDRPLVVVEGAAGAGKTTTLAATRELLAEQGHALVVVTPTLRAAKAARAEVGGRAGSAAWLAYQYGWRWDQHGTWTRLTVGEADPVTGRDYPGPAVKAQLHAGDLLLVDEAGMLDQDTARALLTIADEHRVRVALLGDRHQLPAVGRGGVLDLAHRWADPDACLSLDVVHRFTLQIQTAPGHSRTVPDSEYAALSAAMRSGADPGAVFDTLHTRGQVRIHPIAAEQQQMIAEDVLTARRDAAPVTVVADTREQVAALNAAIRERLVAAGLVDDRQVVTTRAGERVGAGDQVATRRNDRGLDVANRDTWTVTAVGRHGGLTVTNPDSGDRTLPAGYVDRHVEVAYACTVHGAQGETTTRAHLVLGEHTGAASAYVGMTRGRHANTAHIVAADLQEARERWVAAFARDRADLGPAHARELAAAEAARYAVPRPIDQVLAELHQAWAEQARTTERLERAVPIRDQLAEIVALRREQAAQLAPAVERYEHAKQADEQAKARGERSEAVIAARTARLHDTLTIEWNTQLDAAREHARVVLAGADRFELKVGAVNRATDELARWSMTWQPVLADMPTSSRHIAHYADRYLHEPHLHAAFDRYARGQAEQAHPEHRELLNAADTAGRERERAWHALSDTRATQRQQLHRYARLAHIEDPEQRLEQLDHDITGTEHQLADAHGRIGQLANESTIRSRPPEFLTTEHQNWKTNRDTERDATQRAAAVRAGLDAETAARQRMRHAEQHTLYHAPQPDHGPSIGR